MMPWRWRFWRLAGGASDGTLMVDKDGEWFRLLRGRVVALARLRAELEGIDQEIGRTLSDKLEAQEALARRVEAWDVHPKWLRGESAKSVEAIKVASQRARGVPRPEPEKR